MFRLNKAPSFQDYDTVILCTSAAKNTFQGQFYYDSFVAGTTMHGIV